MGLWRAGSDDELIDRDGGESESSIAGSQDVPRKRTTEASEARERDRSLVYRYDNVTMLNLEGLDLQ